MALIAHATDLPVLQTLFDVSALRLACGVPHEVIYFVEPAEAVKGLA